MNSKRCLYRASIAHFPSVTHCPQSEHDYFADGALIVENGKIVDVGDYHTIRASHHHCHEHDYSGKLIVPGLIDSHLHFPQTEMLAAYGEKLLSWLETYTFPIEEKFADLDYSSAIADIFIQQLLKNGTTTALGFSTVHKTACDALFSAASKRNMAFIAGKVCMDRHCPQALQDTPEQAQQDSADLIEKWHGNGRNLYAITPRFAPTSSNLQLKLLGELANEYNDVFIQTHLSETKDEVAWVNALFPHRDGYLDVYDHYGLLRSRTVLGHCVHLTDDEWKAIAYAGASVAFCPSSNLFLGSGLFDLAKAKQHKVHTVLASDIGAGTSFNMLRTYGEAYKISQLQNNPLDPLSGLYMMTQGAAHAHQLSHSIGSLNAGSDADFIVLNTAFDELTTLRSQHNKTCADQLFGLSLLGDDRAVIATYVAGENCLSTNTQELNSALV